jgi:VWFA-related protein
MNMFYRAGMSLLCLSWFSLAAIAQQPADSAATTTPTQESSAASSDSGNKDRQLVLNVVVTDKSGKPVSGLQQQELIVLDNKHPTKILSFQAHGGPPPPGDVDAGTEIVFVLDEVNTTFEKVSYGQDGVKKFLAQNHGELFHPVSLAFFTDSGLQVQTQPSVDGNALVAALNQQEHGLRNVGSSTGFYGAEDRLRLSMDALESLIAQEQRKPGRKMVIWISPGWPLLSGARSDLSSAQAQHAFDSVVRLSTALRQARMTLYSIDPLGAAGSGGERTVFYENFTKGLTDPRHAELGDLGLQVLATQTGGRVIFGNDSIVNSIDRCTADLDAFYVLSIDQAPAERPNEYHSLEIKLEPKGLTARTRTGYYAQP